jgi:hypothetical protein
MEDQPCLTALLWSALSSLPPDGGKPDVQLSVTACALTRE